MLGYFLQVVGSGDDGSRGDADVFVYNFLTSKHGLIYFWANLLTPVILAWPVAGASDKCWSLRETLNEKRLEIMHDAGAMVEVHNMIAVI